MGGHPIGSLSPNPTLDEVQKMTDGYMQKVDQAVKANEKEVMALK